MGEPDGDSDSPGSSRPFDPGEELDAELYHRLFENSINGIAVHEILTDEAGNPVDYRFLDVNERFEEYTGLDARAIVGERVTEVLPGIEETDFIETYGRVALAGESVRFEQYSEPLDRYYDISAFPLGDGLFVTAFVDVTARTEREQELRRYEAILEGMDDAALVIDRNYRLEYANQPVLSFLDRDLEQLRGFDVLQGLDEYVENDAGLVRIERALDSVLEGEPEDAESVKVELVLELPADRVTTEFHCSPVSMENSRKAIVIARDVTERKERERELAETNERLDSFARRLAHELRNPLAVMSARLALLRDTGDQEHLEHLERSISRMERLIDDLLVLANEGEVAIDPGPVWLRTAAEECWEFIRTPETGIETRTETRILADEERLHQLLENLFRNAVEHAGKNVTVTVGDLEDGFYVADDGRGIPEDEREAMFEHGVTDLAHGTGLGLPIVREMARIHGWSVDITDADSGGARFEFRGVDFPRE
jgi:PAS domain S-box-containing protein